MGTVCVASSENDAAPVPKMAGKNGRSTPESTVTVMTDVPTWQLSPGASHLKPTCARCPG